jgi:hypothetical protein
MIDKDTVLSLEQTLRLALEALESTGENNGYHGVTQYFDETMVDQAITAIKAALLSRSDGEAQTRSVVKDEPVAWRTYTGRGYYIIDKTLEEAKRNWPDRPHSPLYTTPPQRTWVGLTDEEKIIMSRYDLEYAALIGEVERKLKEKNGYA